MKTTILYFSPNKKMAKEVLELINSNKTWFGIKANTEEEAIQLFSQYPISIILFGCNVDKETEDKLSVLFKKLNPKIILLDPYGGGGGLLKQEILFALKAKQTESPFLFDGNH